MRSVVVVNGAERIEMDCTESQEPPAFSRACRVLVFSFIPVLGEFSVRGIRGGGSLQISIFHWPIIGSHVLPSVPGGHGSG